MYADAILRSLAKNGVEVSASDFKKGSSEMFISITKGSKAKIKSSFDENQFNNIQRFANDKGLRHEPGGYKKYAIYLK
ncbi:ip7 protein [Escherichia phage OLB35]|uniref:Ip7 protein n=1 Tax=Escherichia phage OLB35 TaxID=2448911 RepID=A0A3G3MBS6_9CAUD|nr:ip7 protein [Escherichia phage OLB35]